MRGRLSGFELPFLSFKNEHKRRQIETGTASFETCLQIEYIQIRAKIDDEKKGQQVFFWNITCFCPNLHVLNFLKLPLFKIRDSPLNTVTSLNVYSLMELYPM